MEAVNQVVEAAGSVVPIETLLASAPGRGMGRVGLLPARARAGPSRHIGAALRARMLVVVGRRDEGGEDGGGRGVQVRRRRRGEGEEEVWLRRKRRREVWRPLERFGDRWGGRTGRTGSGGGDGGGN